MTNETQEITTIKEQSLKKSDNNKSPLTEKIIRLSTIACNRVGRVDFDAEKADIAAESSINGLKPTGELQEMLAAQLISIHRLQQLSMGWANDNLGHESSQYYVSTAIKLANTFAQQASLLNKLQNGEQKIIVERVDVHNGGRAIVGNISGINTTGEVKK